MDSSYERQPGPAYFIFHHFDMWKFLNMSASEQNEILAELDAMLEAHQAARAAQQQDKDKTNDGE